MPFIYIHTHTPYLLHMLIFNLQIYFYIPPGFDMVAIKKDVFRDMGSKLKNRRHSLKRPLNIQDDETPEMVRARMG